MRLSEELFELSASYDITRKNFSRRLDALEAKVEKVERNVKLDGELITHLSRYPHITNTFKEEGSDTSYTLSWTRPESKTCGTCKHHIAKDELWKLSGCWRKYDGKKYYIERGNAKACGKHEYAGIE